MPGQFAAIQTALKAILAGINGTGSYSIDLSGTGAISEEMFSRSATDTLPRAYLTPGSPAARYRTDTGFNDLTSYGCEARFNLVIVVAPADASEGAKTRAAVAAMDSVMIALEANRSISTTALDVEAALSVVQGSELSGYDYGVMYAVLTIPYLRNP